MAEIRGYTEADYPAVQANLEEAGMYDPVCDAQLNLTTMVLGNPQAILVAEVEKEIAGSIYTTPFGINVTCIWRLAVAERYRRQGIGRALLDRVEEIAANEGVKEIWGFFDTSKTDLADYYKSLDYTYNPDHHFFAMWKPIDA